MVGVFEAAVSKDDNRTVHCKALLTVAWWNILRLPHSRADLNNLRREEAGKQGITVKLMHTTLAAQINFTFKRPE